MSFLVQPDPTKCEIALYYRDQRIPGDASVSRIAFSKKTAAKAEDVVNGFFRISDEWDKKLTKCIFLDDINFNWFELNRINDPHVNLGVRLYGDRHLVFHPHSERYDEVYVPREKPEKVLVTVRNMAEHHEYMLGYEQLKSREVVYSVVALFNSSSFKSFSEFSTNLLFGRKVEKIDVSASKL